MDLRWVSPADERVVASAERLLDGPVLPEALRAFLADARHHLCIASVEEVAVGFVSGVELTHPDKGTEMFLYELGVDDGHQRRGIGAALVLALSDLARERGCYGMWVLTDEDNEAALRTYAAAGAEDGSPQVMLTWTFPSTS